MLCLRTATRPGCAGIVKARRVIYFVGMNGDRRHVNGAEALFHMTCFAEERGLWLVIT
jgi:hypothetical protein